MSPSGAVWELALYTCTHASPCSCLVPLNGAGEGRYEARHALRGCFVVRRIGPRCPQLTILDLLLTPGESRFKK